MLKLSFIVPVYNVAIYLPKCLDSLLNQDIDKEDYEIIVVNDGSTDNSGEIAQDYADKHSSIILINQENQGLSGARNTGIQVARGEFVCFVDSDDYWMEDVLGGLMKQIEQDNLDVLRFKWQNVRENGVAFQPYKEANFADFSNQPLSGIDYLNQRMGTQCYACSFIVKKELCWKERFTEGILFEDTDWTPRMLVLAKRVAGTETLVYNYLWRENSITLSRSREKVRKELNDKIQLVKKLKSWNKGVWYDEMIASLLVSIVGILSTSMWMERSFYLKQIKELNVLPLKCGRVGRRKARKIRLINISISMSLCFQHLKNR